MVEKTSCYTLESFATKEKVVAAFAETASFAAELSALAGEADSEYLADHTPMAFKQSQDRVERVSKLVVKLVVELKGFLHSGDSNSRMGTPVPVSLKKFS